jgi:hypothetical protein
MMYASSSQTPKYANHRSYAHFPSPSITQVPTQVIPCYEFAVFKYPLTTLVPLEFDDVWTPNPFFRKHTEFWLGSVGEKMNHVAATQPLYAAHASKQESKLLWTEFAISISSPAVGRISVEQSFTKVTLAVVAL